MAARKTENPKEQVSLTLSKSNMDALRVIATADAEVTMPISRLVDRAISEYLRNRKGKPKPSKTRE